MATETTRARGCWPMEPGNLVSGTLLTIRLVLKRPMTHSAVRRTPWRLGRASLPADREP